MMKDNEQEVGSGYTSDNKKSKKDGRYHPLKFIDSVLHYKKIVLFYEEPEYGKMILVQFIKNGLLKGEHCVYAVIDDGESMEQKMKSSGIDTLTFNHAELYKERHIRLTNYRPCL